MEILKNKTMQVKILLTLIILIVTGVGYYLYSKKYVYTDDAYIKGHSAYISPQVDGYIDGIYVRDNQFVKKGQLLLTISPKIYTQRVNQCKAKYDMTKAQLEEDINVQHSYYAQYRFDLLEYNRYKKLSKVRATSVEVFQNYRTILEKAISSYKAQTVQIRQDKAEIKQAEANLALAKQNLDYTKLYAPFDGWVTKKTVALGNYVSNGNNLMAIVPVDLYVQANYKETKLTHLKIGQPVVITVDAYPGVKFKGHINSIQSGSGAAFSLLPPENATGNFVKIVQRVPVKIVFDKMPSLNKYKLSIGMSVETSIKVS